MRLLKERPVLIVVVLGALAAGAALLHSTGAALGSGGKFVLGGGAGSGGVARFIVSDVVGALAQDLKARGVRAVAVVECATAMVDQKALTAAGITTQCVARPADVAQFEAKHRNAPAAVLRIGRAAAPDGLAGRMLALQLARLGGGGASDAAAAGGGGVRAYAELAVNDTMVPVRAALLDASTGARRLWVLNSRVHLETFNRIYADKLWGPDGGGSGTGSSLEYTLNVRKALLDVLRRYKIKSMMDSSCGSMLWMPLVLREIGAEVPGFKFYGSDVVCPLIEQHRKTFANETNWQFGCNDYANQPLPSGYELIWSRDSLQHVPLHATWQFLSNAKATGAKYLLVGSYIKEVTPNTNIQAGEYYAIDLRKPPFRVRPDPIEIIDERSIDGKHMLMFDLQAMQWDDDLVGVRR